MTLRTEQILSFLDTKAKSSNEDPNQRWVGTWNDYLKRIKHFVRWLYNEYNKKDEKDSIGTKKYSKWVVILPDVFIGELGWKEGAELEAHTNPKNNSLVLQSKK